LASEAVFVHIIFRHNILQKFTCHSLHACVYRDGKPRPCGCDTVLIDAKINFAKEIRLTDYIGRKVFIGIKLVGYYRSNGKEFRKTANLPVEVVK
jgi:hypothetical protein